MYRAKTIAYIILLIIAFMLAMSIFTPTFGQQRQPNGNATSDFFGKGQVSADSVLQAPNKKKVYTYAGFDSVGNLAVVDGKFWYHDGVVWKTNSTFDSSFIYAALADSMLVIRDSLWQVVKYRDSNTVYVTLKRLKDTAATRVKYTDSNAVYVTPKQLRDSVSGRVKYTDSTVIFVTPKQLRDTAATRVKYSDSLTIYATPKNLRDTANSLRTAINGKQNTLSGTGIVKSTAGTISYLPDPLEVSHGGTNSTAFVAGSIPYMNATGTQFLDGIGVIYRDVYTSGLQGIAIFTPAGASAVDAGLTVGTNGGAGLYCLSFPSTLGSSVPHVYGPADQPLNINSAIPLTATTAQAGNNLNLNGADAKAGSSVAGAAKGADIVLNPGDAKRLTSGGAQGGGVIINGGDGIGGGTGGWIAANVSGTGSTGTDLAVYISHTVNGTSTEASTSLLIDRTNTAVGTGNQMYLELQASTVPRTGIASTGAYLFGRQNSGVYNLGLYASTDAGLTQSTGTTRSLFLGAQANTSLTNHIVTVGMMSGTSMQSTATGVSGILRLSGDVIVSSGTTDYSMIYFNGVINQSATANGKVYGAFMTPSLTAVSLSRWHSFATDVNSPQRAFWGTGTGLSSFGGTTLIGTTTDNSAGALQVNGAITSVTPNTGLVTDPVTVWNSTNGQFRRISMYVSVVATGNTTSSVPALNEIHSIWITPSCTCTENIKIGTTSGGTDVMALTAFTGTAGTTTTIVILNNGFSRTASQTLFIQGASGLVTYDLKLQ